MTGFMSGRKCSTALAKMIDDWCLALKGDRLYLQLIYPGDLTRYVIITLQPYA